jgi:hypothetical protein
MKFLKGWPYKIDGNFFKWFGIFLFNIQILIFLKGCIVGYCIFLFNIQILIFLYFFFFSFFLAKHLFFNVWCVTCLSQCTLISSIIGIWHVQHTMHWCLSIIEWLSWVILNFGVRWFVEHGIWSFTDLLVLMLGQLQPKVSFWGY